MKRKTKQVTEFIENLNRHLITSPKLPKNVRERTEKQIQKDIYHITLEYLEDYFMEAGLDKLKARQKAGEVFYWEGQDRCLRKDGNFEVFGARNYPDFVISEPYQIAIEYAQSPSGASIKRGIGQSIMHTICGEYDFVYYLFCDKSDDRRIEKSMEMETEKLIRAQLWSDFNVFMGYVRQR